MNLSFLFLADKLRDALTQPTPIMAQRIREVAETLEYAHRDEQAALAQQAQPTVPLCLNCGVEIKDFGSDLGWRHVDGNTACVKRDPCKHMAHHDDCAFCATVRTQQAQPCQIELIPPYHLKRMTCRTHRTDHAFEAGVIPRLCPLAQRAQPVMPTREMIACSYRDLFQGEHPDGWAPSPSQVADAVLALFTPKEAQ